MRLKQEEISRIARQILQNLKEKGVAVLKVGGEKVLARIEAVFVKNLSEESAIEEEVRRLMDQYRAQVASGAIDPQKAYQMIKKQVAKDRKFIL